MCARYNGRMLRRSLLALAMVLAVTSCSQRSDSDLPVTDTLDASVTTPAPSAAPSTAAVVPDTTAAPTSTEAPLTPMTILVTNDDGVAAPGIDALVTALSALPDVEVVVVAPASNQSGSSDSTTPGGVTAQDATTISGHPAVAVNGFPADAVNYALDELGLQQKVQNSHRLSFCSGSHTLVCNRSGHRNGIAPMVPGKSGNIGRKSQRHCRYYPRHITDVIRTT